MDKKFKKELRKKTKEETQAEFFFLLDTLKITRPVPEYIFHNIRKWRIDFAWPEEKIALEIEGGIFVGGRHSRGAGMQADFTKYNEAALLGWRIFKCVPKDLCKTATIQLLRKSIISNQ